MCVCVRLVERGKEVMGEGRTEGLWATSEAV